MLAAKGHVVFVVLAFVWVRFGKAYRQYVVITTFEVYSARLHF